MAFSPVGTHEYSSSEPYAICIGSGRFLRAVLVPALTAIGQKVIVAQTRGSHFVEAMKSIGKYQVDTVLRDGSVETQVYEIAGVGSLGRDNDRSEFMKLPKKLKQFQIIGVGVTEAGLQTNNPTMSHLAEFLHSCFQENKDRKLSIINTDNVPNNGDVIAQAMRECPYSSNLTHDKAAFLEWLGKSVTFHNTMVDRITAARPDDDLVPYAEPLPAKALVIEDLQRVLPPELENCDGVICRRHAGEIIKDRLLKLQIANGTHTSMVYAMALAKLENTTECINHPLILPYLEKLFRKDILPGLTSQGIESKVALDVYEDWIDRLTHPHFGMDVFFVCQNATTKLPIRVLSSVFANIENDPEYRASPYMAFATAAVLRFITPFETKVTLTKRGRVFKGKMDPLVVKSEETSSWEYATGLYANLEQGCYDFRDSNNVASILQHVGCNALPEEQIGAYVVAALLKIEGMDLTIPALHDLAMDVVKLYCQMLPWKSTGIMQVLESILHNEQHLQWIPYKDIENTVLKAVQDVEVIDVHTHLFPPSHGDLMLWGIDELITYHYLVAEFLMTAPAAVTPEVFYAMDKQAQADLIWQHLFIDRLPVSEACRGVITTLGVLGLTKMVENRDLQGIRAWFSAQDKANYVERVFREAKVHYVVMTNIPFDPTEAQHWLGEPKPFDRTYFRSALRVDQLLTGDWATIERALEHLKYEKTLDGCRQYLLEWIRIMQPEYFMTSVPFDFVYPTDEEMAKYPPDTINACTLLRRVLLPLAQEQRLPLALKFDSVRPINPRLGIAGDGVRVTSVTNLQQLCLNYPNVKFLATFLSRVNQHEVCVLANKFSNLHLYGCWWYCNNPSIIDEMTRMRLEILGTGFTSQHSDARVLDQLLYKWKHSRAVIGPILVEMYQNLSRTGWKISREEIYRDIKRLFGGSYEEFMRK